MALIRTQQETELKHLETQLLDLKQRETQLQQEIKEHLENRQLLESAKASLETELKTLNIQHQQWTETLNTRWQQQFEAFMLKYLDEAKKNFEEKASKDYTEKQTGFEQKMQTMLKPLTEMLENYKKEVLEIGKQHHAQTSSIKEQVFQLTQTSNKLVVALSHNKGRGDWGELELIRLLEDSQLKEGYHYVKQTSIGSERKRPDIRINLPENRYIFVDAKALRVDLDDFSEDPQVSSERPKRFANSLWAAVKDLSSKGYQDELAGTADFVVLYVPREAMLFEALCADPTLFEKAYQRNVMLAGPFNLIALLKIVRLGWFQAELSENAEKILELGKDLHKRACTFADNFDRTSKSLDQLSKNFQKTWTSFDGQQGFLKQLKKLEDYGCKSPTKNLPDEITLPEHLHQLTLPPGQETHQVSSEEAAEETIGTR